MRASSFWVDAAPSAPGQPQAAVAPLIEDADAPRTSRVAEDRSYAGPDDQTLVLPELAHVRIAHPASTPGLAALWSTLFGDYELS